MAYITDYQYYENNRQDANGVVDTTVNEGANWGSYQYVSLLDIVNNYLLMYSGNHSLVNNEERYKILFHAKRAVQELNYDAFKEVKVLELDGEARGEHLLNRGADGVSSEDCRRVRRQENRVLRIEGGHRIDILGAESLHPLGGAGLESTLVRSVLIGSLGLEADQRALGDADR